MLLASKKRDEIDQPGRRKSMGPLAYQLGTSGTTRDSIDAHRYVLGEDRCCLAPERELRVFCIVDSPTRLVIRGIGNECGNHQARTNRRVGPFCPSSAGKPVLTATRFGKDSHDYLDAETSDTARPCQNPLENQLPE